MTTIYRLVFFDKPGNRYVISQDYVTESEARSVFNSVWFNMPGFDKGHIEKRTESVETFNHNARAGSTGGAFEP